MKILLLGLGTIGAVTAPVAMVVACGTDAKTKTISLDLTNDKTIQEVGAAMMNMQKSFSGLDEERIKIINIKIKDGDQHFEYTAKDEEGKTDGELLKPFYVKMMPFYKKVFKSRGFDMPDLSLDDIMNEVSL